MGGHGKMVAMRDSSAMLIMAMVIVSAGSILEGAAGTPETEG